MSALPDTRVLFRAAAGARRGFGHLVRCRSLARALGVRPLVCVRGTAAARDVALRLGCDVVDGPARRLIGQLAPDLLVVDDPIASHASRWIAAARVAGVPVVTIHDLGLGSQQGDLSIDGSVTGAAWRARRQRTAGPAFAILDPAVASARAHARHRAGIIVSLGGGPRADVAFAIANEIAWRAPEVDVRVAGGFVSSAPARTAPPNLTWLGPSTDLAVELTKAEVAVVGGGVSLYEACAAGTAAVGVPVVPAQRPTVAGFVARGAALGRPRAHVEPRRVADDALRLLRESGLRRRVARTGRRLVDGRGAGRAARAIERLLERR
jgi:spore coat polysaccharide biosynthesis predicted glycosyltransferase SpsG